MLPLFFQKKINVAFIS